MHGCLEFLSDLLPAVDGLYLGKYGDVVLVGTAPSEGSALSSPPYGVRYYDPAGVGAMWDVGMPAILDVDDDYVYTVGTDVVLVGTEPPNGSAIFDPGLLDKYYDVNGNVAWDIDEPAIKDDGDDVFHVRRRWNFLLNRLLPLEEPSSFQMGRLWYRESDGHPYLDRPDLAQALQIPLVGDAPTIHDNEAHSLAFLAYFLPMGSWYVTDVSVGSAAAVTLASVSATAGRWNIPSGIFNFRPAATNTANRTLSVWWETPLGTQHSAKYPITVVLNEAKRPFTFGLCHSGIGDLGFWQSRFASSATIYLRAQTDAETVLVSDRYLNVLQVGPT